MEDNAAPNKLQEKYERKLFNSGVFYLQRYAASIDHFKTILSKKLKKKWQEEDPLEESFAKTLIEKTVTKLTNYGALNNDAYASQLYRKYHQQGFGRSVIMQKMKLKKLSDAEIKAAETAFLEENSHTNNDEAEHERALLFFKRKVAKLKLPEEQEKAVSRMARAGFSYSVIKDVLKSERGLQGISD